MPAGCDVYVLRDVLHDQDDLGAGRILAACGRAAGPDARVVVAEILLDRTAAASPGLLIDVQMMMATTGSRQRSASEHAALLSRAGFRAGRVIELPGVPCLVEGVAS